MPSTKRARLDQWIREHQPGQITPHHFHLLSEELAPISESYLRKLLRDTGIPLAPTVEGVRQGNLEELESTLLALLQEYESSDAEHKQAIRKIVITAKDHARWRRKEENVLWLLTWLENPPLFPAWAKLRKPRT